MHDLFVEPFSFLFMRQALLCGLLVSISGSLVGCFLVMRRLALMGDALAHSLFPGIALAFLFFGTEPYALLAGALVAGLFTALGSATVSRLTRVKEEAAFATFFIMLFALGVALLSWLGPQINPLHYLFGNILAVGPEDLALALVVTFSTLVAFMLFRRPLLLETFDPGFFRVTGGRGGVTHLGLMLFAVLNLVAALRAMGIILSLGLFIIPAVTAHLWADRWWILLLLSAALACLATFAGVLVSYHVGVASGAAIVLCLGLAFLFSAFLSPRYGLIRRWRRPERGQYRVGERHLS